MHDTSLDVQVCKLGVELSRTEVVQVTANELVLLRETEHAHLLGDEEEDGTEAGRPDGDADAADNLKAKELS